MVKVTGGHIQQAIQCFKDPSVTLKEKKKVGAFEGTPNFQHVHCICSVCHYTAAGRCEVQQCECEAEHH